jgi:hypothetical protein
MSTAAQGNPPPTDDPATDAEEALAACNGDARQSHQRTDWMTFSVVQPFCMGDDGFELAAAIECSSREHALRKAKQMSDVYGGAVAFVRPLSDTGKYGPATLLAKFGNVPEDPLSERWGWGPT